MTMTRVQIIDNLKARYRRLMHEGKTVTARAVLLRLRPLMTFQIKAEDRQDRKKRA